MVAPTIPGVNADSTQRQLGLLRVYAAFTYPFACVPFLYFYFADHGVTLQQYGWLIAIYYWTMVTAEVPTGVLADRFGRVVPVVLGPTVLAAGFACMAYFDSFWAFAVGEVAMGLGHSILSGPPTAILFETLRRSGRGSEYLHHESRMHFARLSGTGISFLIGGIIAHFYGYRASIVLTIGLCLVAAVTALFLRDTKSTRTSNRRVPILASAMRDLRLPPVRWILAYFIVLFCLLRYPFHFYQPFLRENGFDQPLRIGLLFFAMNVVAAPCGRMVPWLDRRFGERALFWGLLVSLSLSIWAMAHVGIGFAIGLFFVQQVPFGMHWAAVQSFVNHHLRDASRATVLSTISFASRLAFAIALPATMWVADQDVEGVFGLVGIGGTAIAILVMVWGTRYLSGHDG